MATRLKLVFASHNAHKVKEIGLKLEEEFEVLSLDDIACLDDIPETGITLEENAILKARYVYKKFGLNCFADDTGLEVKALNGAPGVISARYAGEGRNSEDNIDKLLWKLDHLLDRDARFRTVICFINNGDITLFEGIVNGRILLKRQGAGGFGYDAIFEPEGYEISFAEMSMEEKNKISHRGKAVDLLIAHLKNMNISI